MLKTVFLSHLGIIFHSPNQTNFMLGYKYNRNVLLHQLCKIHPWIRYAYARLLERKETKGGKTTTP
jgi:hypothetical protein